MEYSKISNIGNREINEDCVDGKVRCINNQEVGCFILADGLGGHGRGEVASQLVVDVTMDYFSTVTDTDNMLENILMEGQMELLSLQKTERTFNELKTTSVILLIDAKAIYWCHMWFN